jgi:hypothetical protein
MTDDENSVHSLPFSLLISMSPDVIRFYRNEIDRLKSPRVSPEAGRVDRIFVSIFRKARVDCAVARAILGGSGLIQKRANEMTVVPDAERDLRPHERAIHDCKRG